MYAVIRTGGKQYRVAKDDVVRIEKLAGEPGDTITFDQVVMVGGEDGTQVGAPVVEGATVQGEVVDQTRNRKVLVFKKKRRKNYRRTAGHRQHVSVIRITDILAAGQKKTKKKSAAKKKAEPAPKAEAAGDAAAPEAAASEE